MIPNSDDLTKPDPCGEVVADSTRDKDRTIVGNNLDCQHREANTNAQWQPDELTRRVRGGIGSWGDGGAQDLGLEDNPTTTMTQSQSLLVTLHTAFEKNRHLGGDER